MTLDEIKARHDADARSIESGGLYLATVADRDRAQLLAWLEAALPCVRRCVEFDDKIHSNDKSPTELLSEMGVQ